MERRRRPSDLEREKEPKDKDKFDAKIEKQTVSRIAPGFEVKCRVVWDIVEQRAEKDVFKIKPLRAWKNPGFCIPTASNSLLAVAAIDFNGLPYLPLV